MLLWSVLLEGLRVGQFLERLRQLAPCHAVRPHAAKLSRLDRLASTEPEAYLNLDQDHLTISVNGERLYDAEIPGGPGSAA